MKQSKQDYNCEKFTSICVLTLEWRNLIVSKVVVKFMYTITCTNL